MKAIGMQSCCLQAIVYTMLCTTLHISGANKVMELGICPIARGDFKWADAVTVRTRRGVNSNVYRLEREQQFLSSLYYFLLHDKMFMITIRRKSYLPVNM